MDTKKFCLLAFLCSVFIGCTLAVSAQKAQAPVPAVDAPAKTTLATDPWELGAFFQGGVGTGDRSDFTFMPSVETTDLDGVLKITPARFADERGFFSETYSFAAYPKIGVNCAFVQDNQSLSRRRGTVRGLHFQVPPFAQAKLVRVVRGAIWDVALDIRRASPNFGRSAGVLLSAENGCQLFVPAGFAHGFCTLEENSEVLYKVDAAFSREHERGLYWNDPRLGIAWPIPASDAVLSERDHRLPRLDELEAYF